MCVECVRRSLTAGWARPSLDECSAGLPFTLSVFPTTSTGRTVRTGTERELSFESKLCALLGENVLKKKKKKKKTEVCVCFLFHYYFIYIDTLHTYQHFVDCQGKHKTNLSLHKEIKKKTRIYMTIDFSKRKRNKNTNIYVIFFFFLSL